MSDDADCAMFLSAVNLSSFGSYIDKGKRVAITFHENQILNLGNYHKFATGVTPGIIDKFEVPFKCF